MLTRIRENFNRYYVTTTGIVFDKKYHRRSSVFKSNKYKQCRLVDNGGAVHIMGLHVAVAMFHSIDYFPGCVVHHKDNNQENNNLINLECTTRTEHSALHARITNQNMKPRIPWNKGKKMSADYCNRCKEAAKKRQKHKSKY